MGLHMIGAGSRLVAVSLTRLPLLSPARLLSATLTALVLVSGCTSADRPSVQAESVALATPLASLPTPVARTAGLLSAALGAAGYRLDPAAAPFRPSEPQGLLAAPRAVLRASLADPEDGHVVIYLLTDAATARERAVELAAYLGSGFGQTNYAPDAQFSVGVVGDTVIFTSWSRARSSDPERSEEVFDAVRSVGEPIEVLK